MDSSLGGPAGAPVRNRLLCSLPTEEIERLRPLLTRVTLVTGQVLHEYGSRIEDVFFIEEGLASVVADTLDHGHVEVGLAGRDGMIGAIALLNPDATAVHRAFVQISGSAWRIRAAALRQAVEESPALRDRCLRYVQLIVVHTAQSAACNARHEMTERLARWLLMCHDRVEGNELPLTQELLALMLGVRRAGVSVSAGILQAGGFISHSRGRITVLDRAGLEKAACDCYHLIRRTGEEILGHPSSL